MFTSSPTFLSISSSQELMF